MVTLSEKELAKEVPKAVAALLDVPTADVDTRLGEADEADLIVTAGGYTLLVELSHGVTPGPIAAHARHVANAAKKTRRKVIPAVVVPFMSEGGRRACADAEVSWFDLSGNAHITGPGLKVIVDGRPNRFRAPGRPSSVFAPKSARVVRLLLEHPRRMFTQREIARETNMSEGFVSRIVGRLEADSYLERADVDGAGNGRGDGYGYGSGDGGGFGDGDGGDGHGGGYGDGRRHPGKAPVRVRDPSLLLDAWHDEYQFEKHRIIRGHVAARSGEALAHLVGDALAAAQIDHAATGLAAAWELTHFAAFRIATFFVAAEPPPETLAKLGFRDDPRGANLWLVVPNDEGVFQGAEAPKGLRCVHPVQAYVDLKEHPERATEAAERLRSEYLTWKKRDV
jgi:MarR family/Transcriptional regulator, AbiEi antitoxin, Type IV TA system